MQLHCKDQKHWIIPATRPPSPDPHAPGFPSHRPGSRAGRYLAKFMQGGARALLKSTAGLRGGGLTPAANAPAGYGRKDSPSAAVLTTLQSGGGPFRAWPALTPDT